MQAALSHQVDQADAAWRTLVDTLQPWTAAAPASSSAASAPITTPALPPAAPLRHAYHTLHSLRLDNLFQQHVREEICKPFIEQSIAGWWSEVEKMQVSGATPRKKSLLQKNDLISIS
jgi:hypothetical protein